MKCKSQPAFLKHRPAKIEDIWEVRLAEPLWNRIGRSSRKYGVSFSEISRYCVFRLAEKGCGLKKERFKKILADLRETHACKAALHRHMVCFYGEDIKLVRLAALEMGVTVSTLVRLALMLYLPRLEMEIHNEKAVTAQELFWLGIKRWIQVAQTKINNLGVPTFRHFSFSSFPPTNWWGRRMPDNPFSFSF
ncbi:hypothetical protein Turpa_2842 [Turneriella parva DSM 21527]|uniref:Uncharacterized protein n=2 Tax=Turneriella TaxID=338321 RepID=I4B874_TURPD|nr:hypothetical protein Turpa_2842 [Turneriella parva DSM 21527]